MVRRSVIDEQSFATNTIFSYIYVLFRACLLYCIVSLRAGHRLISSFVGVLTDNCAHSVRSCVANAKSAAMRTAALRAVRVFCRTELYVQALHVTGIDFFIAA